MTNSKSIVCFDIDDTLITGQPSVFPESAKQAIRRLQENAHLAMINTGRVFYSTPSIIKEFGFDGLICGCGSSIYLHGEKLFHSRIPHALCLEVIEQLRACRIAAFFESDSAIYMDDKSPIQLPSPMREGMKMSLQTTDFSSLSKEEALSFTFDKFCTVLDEHSDYEAFRSFCDQHFTYIDRGLQGGFRFGEIIQKDFSKATGITYLMNHFQIPLENCYAIGDSTNDLAMLEYVPHGIAMGNASPAILPYCEYQTTHILENGIANALAHYHLI